MLYTDKGFRAMFLVKTFKSGQVHQTTPITCMNRYTHIFSYCRGFFKDNEDVNILSYGCPTGEEVITIRDYFPSATIVGQR